MRSCPTVLHDCGIDVDSANKPDRRVLYDRAWHHGSVESGHKIGGLAILRRTRSPLPPSRSLRVKEVALDHPLQHEKGIDAIVSETGLE